LEEAKRPVFFEVKGTIITFLAYNSVLPMEYWATESRPGCAPLLLCMSRLNMISPELIVAYIHFHIDMICKQ
ncbi:MAG: hypothetical protein QW738_07865, partial [Nitrososphaeria archaeon]